MSKGEEERNGQKGSATPKRHRPIYLQLSLTSLPFIISSSSFKVIGIRPQIFGDDKEINERVTSGSRPASLSPSLSLSLSSAHFANESTESLA
jgi:hypothetical protein